MVVNLRLHIEARRRAFALALKRLLLDKSRLKAALEGKLAVVFAKADDDALGLDVA